jgi:hypothetical protein
MTAADPGAPCGACGEVTPAVAGVDEAAGVSTLRIRMLRQIDPPPTTDASRHCGSCGYDLRGIVEPRCPECGVAFDPGEPPIADVPWFHRRHIGVFAALWWTMWLVMLRPERLRRAVRARDVRLDMPAARRFRHACVCVASASMAVAVALQVRPVDNAALMFVITVPPLLLFFGLTAPLIATADFNTPNRAASFQVLHEFSNAPLLLMPLVALAAAWGQVAGLTPSMAVLLLLAIAALWIVCKFAYQAREYGRGFVWLGVHLIFAVVVWAVFALMCLALLLGLVVFTRRLFDW